MAKDGSFARLKNARKAFPTVVGQLNGGSTKPMKRNAVGKNGHQISNGFSSVWSTTPWLTLHKIGAHHGYRIDGAEQARYVSAYTSQNERTAARTVAGARQEHRRKETEQQGVVLSSWDGDGGPTAKKILV
jgi:hypothetical protein